LALGVYDLSVDVFLYLVGFQRRFEEGEPLSYEDTRREVLTLISELDRRSHTEPGLWENWRQVINPLVYLIDEVMNINCQWPHREQWQNDVLEVRLLAHPVALGGENFYTECDEALKELERAEAMNRQDIKARQEIIMVYYVAMQLGFKGRYAVDPNMWREYKLKLFTKLPASASTKTKELFPETDDHTDRRPPQYPAYLPLMYVGIGAAVLLVAYFVLTYFSWTGMISRLEGYARDADQALKAGAPTASAPAGQ
jgi:type IV/VI secretion system ImpK/VasF family protein